MGVASAAGQRRSSADDCGASRPWFSEHGSWSQPVRAVCYWSSPTTSPNVLMRVCMCVWCAQVWHAAIRPRCLGAHRFSPANGRILAHRPVAYEGRGADSVLPRGCGRLHDTVACRGSEWQRAQVSIRGHRHVAVLLRVQAAVRAGAVPRPSEPVLVQGLLRGGSWHALAMPVPCLTLLRVAQGPMHAITDLATKPAGENRDDDLPDSLAGLRRHADVVQDVGASHVW